MADLSVAVDFVLVIVGAAEVRGNVSVGSLSLLHFRALLDFTKGRTAYDFAIFIA